jgi:hypothetical protein
MVSFVCDGALRASVSLVRCAHTPRPNLLAAIADGLPILLVDRPRRQLSRPPHDDRRRGARGTQTEFVLFVAVCESIVDSLHLPIRGRLSAMLIDTSLH